MAGKKRLCAAAGCRELVTDSARCNEHKKEISRASTTKYAHIYNGRQWRSVRKGYYQMNPLCVMCSRDGALRAGDVVDHIIEIDTLVKTNRERLIYCHTNLQTLCHYHHNNKTIQYKKANKPNNKPTRRI